MAHAFRSINPTHDSNDSKLVINPQQVGGLIVCYEHHAEFLGPGAIAHSPAASGHTHMVALGNPIVLPVTDQKAIAAAYRQRLQWLAWLARLTGVGDSTERCRRLLQGLEGLFNAQDVSQISDEVLALLIGVFPMTMTAVRVEYRRRSQVPVNAKRPRTNAPGSKSVFAASRGQGSLHSFSAGSSRGSGLSPNPKRSKRSSSMSLHSVPSAPNPYFSGRSQTIA